MFFLILLQSFTDDAIEMSQKKIDIEYYLEAEVPQNKIDFLQSALLRMKKKGDIASFRYISPEETLEGFAEKYPEKYLYWKRVAPDENPFLPSVTIVPKNQNVETITRYLFSDDFAGIINSSNIEMVKKNLLTSNRVLEFLNFLGKGMWLFVAVILLAIVGVTASFISTSFLSRQKEISIMQLVGASHSFIRNPFAIEGLLMSSIALFFGWILFYFIYKFIVQYIVLIFSAANDTQEVVEKINTMWNDFFSLVPWTIGGILAVSFLVSWLTIETILRKKNVLN
jgi:cell division transport system permease protein